MSAQNQNNSPLKSFLSQGEGKAKPHERLGRGVATLLLRELFNASDAAAGTKAAQVTFALAESIMGSEEDDLDTRSRIGDSIPLDAAGRVVLHQRIDGEIDCDRCDYLLRDGRNYDFEFARYDLERLLDNLTVHFVSNRFQVAILPHGITAAESFLIARYRSYQNGVRYHKVAQVGAALQHSILTILKQDGVPNGLLDVFLADLGKVVAGENTDQQERGKILDRFAGYDDVWWMSHLRAFEPRDSWLDLVCWRKPGPVTLWKWRGSFPSSPLPDWNRRLPTREDETNVSSLRPLWDDAARNLDREGV